MTEETIFLAALDKKEATERAAFLESACAGNPALRERVEALLCSHEDPDSFLDVPALERQAAGIDDPNHTTGLPLAEKKHSPRAEPTPSDDALAFLAPAREPGSLGRLDHYEVLELVGRGGMGVVFKARDTRLQRVVAIKVLAPQLAVNGTARKRFVREAQAAAAVRDEHVVSIHAVSEEGAVPYLVMEFIAGITLAERVKQGGPLEVKEVLRIGLQAAKGLEAAHAQGLIHRDVTPGNILLENGVQRVKLTDFGLARAGNDASLTQSGVIAGTPLYMSPEQARGEALDSRSDLFSLGSVLYTLCTGRPAFSAGNSMAVLKKVCDDVPRPLREANPDIPDWLAAIVNKLMAKDPAERFQTAAKLARLLEQHLAELQQSRLASRPLAAVKGGASPAKPLPQPDGGVPHKRKRFAVAAVLLLLAASLGTVAVLFWPQLFPLPKAGSEGTAPVANKNGPPVSEDPRVLTVSRKPEGGGRFRTISEALEKVEPGMTIRVLDDAVYEENLLINRPRQHRGVVLEATKKASLRLLPSHKQIVGIKDVPDFTLRGLRFESGSGRHHQISITGACPGVVLDRLDMLANKDGCCIAVDDMPPSGDNAPIVVQNCIMHSERIAVAVDGRTAPNWDLPTPCGGVLIRNNTMSGCGQSVLLTGAVHHVHIVGNRIMGSKFTAIDVIDPLPGAEAILIANNTMLGNETALRVWDDSTKGKDFLKCKNFRFHNNLVLATRGQRDLVLLDHRRGNLNESSNGDVLSLRNSPEWRFSHNWREIIPLKPDSPRFTRWIPDCPHDRLQVSIDAGSRKSSDPTFLRPPKDSPLARAGVNDAALPAYVGAVPPEGVQPWNWDWTWDAQARRLLTVSKKPEGGGRFRTITEALEKVEAGMTIRVLDDGVYEEHLLISRPVQYRGVVLEAVGKATIRMLPQMKEIVRIRGVPGFTMRGLHLESSEGGFSQVNITGHCPGVVLDRLHFTGDKGNACVEIWDVSLVEKDPPLMIQNCTMRNVYNGLLMIGHTPRNADRSQPCGHVVFRNNTLVRCYVGVILNGAICRTQVVGNHILDSHTSALDLKDLLPGAADVLVANNTLVRNRLALRVWDDSTKGKEFLKCKNIHFQNNLVLEPGLEVDLGFLDHRRGNDDQVNPADVPALLKSPQWRFSHNWREIAPLPPDSRYYTNWIPPCLNDHLQVPIKILSRTPGNSDFLRPPKDSPLAKAGVNDAALPAYVGAVPPEGVQPWNWDWTWDIRVRRLLTVSKNPEYGGRFRTINDALTKVEAGMTIRVLDDGVYDEHLLINRTEQQRNVTLEAVGKATIRPLLDKHNTVAVRIRGVSGFTLRGLHFNSDAGDYSQVAISGPCPGVVLDRLTMKGDRNNACIEIWDVSLSSNDPPIVIQNCAMQGAGYGVSVSGHFSGNRDRPQPCGHLVIHNNTLVGTGQGVALHGAVYRTHIVGNRILESYYSAFDLIDLLPGTADVLVANNTLVRNRLALRIWDDNTKGRDILKCKNMRIQNNLVLASQQDRDLIFNDHRRGNFQQVSAGEVPLLLKSPEWRFSHNWRELAPPKADNPNFGYWIPKLPHDRLEVPIQVGSRQLGSPNFLCPPKDSPLATSGAGSPVISALKVVSAVGNGCDQYNLLLAAWLTADMMSQTERWLPSYVGAVPPEGVEPWDWKKTWKALAR